MKRALGFPLVLLVVCATAFFVTRPRMVGGAGNTYYVSNSGGSDSNDGLSTSYPFKTIAKVNGLALQPGDQVLFKCGDTWRAEMLIVSQSGAASSPITYSSYPATDCADKPILSGAQPITGWTVYSGNIYVADLSAGVNVTNFPPATTSGINQLFRNGQRLGIGRWPNIDAPDGGYSTIDAQPSATQITDNQLPAENWTGATAHIKGMRWYILNRTVTSDSGNTLTVNSDLDCWGNCVDWGFWLTDHLKTLDRDGEWYYDRNARKVYLFSSNNPNSAAIEGAVVITGESAYLGGVILGKHLQQHVAHVIVENFEINDWFDNGVTTPVNLEKDENSDIIIRNNLIRDVDSVGINLATWVWNAEANGNGYNGWRGGRDIQIVGNTIEGANHMGINSYARQSLIQDNVIRDIALIKNLGQAGMGCSTTSGGGMCTEDGDGVRIKVDGDGTYSGNSVTVRYNRIERTGYNGIDVFGYNNTFDSNLILYACTSKGDCGGLRSFGGDNLSSTLVRNLTIANNIIVDTIGNTGGCRSDFDALFGFGLYIDHYSKDVTASGNTVISSTVHGILYQDSTGTIQNNTLFNNSSGTLWADQVAIASPPSPIASLTGNIMLGITSTAGTLQVGEAGQLAVSDNNRFYHANRAAHISAQGDMTLAQWKTYSGKDTHSTEMISAALATSEIFYNDTKVQETIYLSRSYVDLDGHPVAGSIVLQPFTSKILLPSGAPTPNLTIAKSAPAWVNSGGRIMYTLAVVNHGGAGATNLVVTDTLPANVSYLSGGTLAGSVVSWTAVSLSPGEAITFTFTVTPMVGIKLIVNDDYRVSADGGYGAVGVRVVTLVDPQQVFLPLVMR